MATKKQSVGFRKIDIDQYGENVFKDDETSLEPQSGSVGVDENEVKKLIQSGRSADALKQLLSTAPLSTKNQVIKDKANELLLQLLLGVRASEIDNCLTGLETDQLDILMKYIYRGFETPNEGSSGHLLVWHEKVFALAGVGSIVRVLTDKKRV